MLEVMGITLMMQKEKSLKHFVDSNRITNQDQENIKQDRKEIGENGCLGIFKIDPVEQKIKNSSGRSCKSYT